MIKLYSFKERPHMAQIAVHCPACHLSQVIKFGFTAKHKQRFRCINDTCPKKTFILTYTNKGYLPEVKRKIIEMALNGSGVRDTVRVLGIGINTVLNELKKKKS